MTSQPGIEFASRKWQDAEIREGTSLLRLAVLRDLSRELHAEKSRILSMGTREEALNLQNLENHIESLKSGLGLTLPTLAEAIQLPITPAPAPSKPLPRTFLEVITADNFHRSDRQWELALAHEALRLKWNFWTLEGRIPIPRIEEAGNAIELALWPHGVSLFTESLSFTSKPPQWTGKWTFTFHAKIEPASLFPPPKVDYFSGSKWKLLFSGSAP